MLTIGQLASYAGVTVRAVRHYHLKGLLPEPERDASGYRTYDAGSVVELIKIRTLADAGVPLSRVKDLLAAGEAEFAAAVADIDRRLRDDIRNLQRHRRRIAQLAAGDSVALPPVVVGYLDRLRAEGVADRLVDAERDAWILVAAHHPGHVEAWIGMKLHDLEDPEYVALYRDLGECLDWESDDPRLELLADRLAAYVRRVEEDEDEEPPEGVEDFDDPFVTLLEEVVAPSLPVLRRLEELLVARGVGGSTGVAGVDAPVG